MRKFLALCLTFCMTLICISILAHAADIDSKYQKDIISSNTFDGKQILEAFEVTVNKDGESIIVPYNEDLMQIPGYSGSFYVKSGKNVKIHVDIKTITGTVTVYACKGSVGNAYKPANIKAKWKGTGHHWADLFLNADAGQYSVFLYGAFTGTGAVYTEP